MKKILFITILLAASSICAANSSPFKGEVPACWRRGLPTQTETQRHYLSGKDKDNTVQWDFKVTSGRNSNRWTKIPVPSCWETQGFGTFYYGWEEPETSDETGFYRHTFKADKAWQGQHVEIIFEGSMTDTEVKINGNLVGEVHEGGFYQFSYDITHLLQYGKKNLLEVKVAKRPANKSIYNAERQTDFWLFGGIYRPVFLEIKPQQHIQSVAIDARWTAASPCARTSRPVPKPRKSPCMWKNSTAPVYPTSSPPLPGKTSAHR